MLRSESEKLVKITTNVFESDWKWMHDTFNKAGASKALRQLLRKFRNETERKQKEAKGKLNVNVELD